MGQVASERVVNGVKTRVLHGKDYVEVAERVHQVYEQQRVLAMVQSEPVEIAGRWIWRAVITVDEHQYIGNAEIKFDAPKNTPDGTNPFECAETSALGRALAFAGFGSVEAIASKDEVMRGQPFTIEPVQNGRPVVEAGNSRQIAAPTTRPNAPQSGNGHQPQHTVPTEAKPQPAPVQSQRTPLGQAMYDAIEVGFVSGATKEARAASWQEQIIMIFGKALPEDELSQPANLARINGAIEAHRRHVAERKATSGK